MADKLDPEGIRAARPGPEEQERKFPVLPSRGAKAHPLTIPWSVAEKAYSVYAAEYGTGQSLERLAQRGGFHANELDEFHPSWREEAGEIAQLKAERAALRAAARVPPSPPQCANEGHCPCDVGTRHFWFEAFCAERDKARVAPIDVTYTSSFAPAERVRDRAREQKLAARVPQEPPASGEK